MSGKQPAVYSMASGERQTLYVGITGSLRHRVHEHREGLIEGFTERYQVTRLVWFELHADFLAAIAREKQLKKWNRVWKLKLIENSNRAWRDLWDDIQE